MPEESDSKRQKTSQTEFPIYSLKSALRIADAIWDQFAGRGAAPHQIALALNLSPTSGGWRNLCGSAIAYGLTEGGYNAAQISLTPLGRAIVAPTEEGGSEHAKVEAILKPRLMGEFFRKYDRGKFPKDEIGTNVLSGLGLPKERAVSAFEVIKENGKEAGVILDTRTGPFVALNDPRPVVVSDSHESIDEKEAGLPANDIDPEIPASQQDISLQTGPKQLFVAHGKNRKPLEDLKKILDQFAIPYRIAVDEAHAGRPISKKVGDLMRECSAGIFVFTCDEKFIQGDSKEIWRPSENVVYELGAASILWDRKIIIVREEGVNFPSDFSDLGYITFKEGEIASKALDILKELVGLGLVKVQAA